MKSASHIDVRSESAPTGLNEPCTNGRPLRDRDISGSDQPGRMNSKAPLFNGSSPSRYQMVRGSNDRVWILLVVTSAVLTRLWSTIGAAVGRRMLPSVVADHKLQTSSAPKSRLSTDLTIVPVSHRVVTPPPTNPNGPPSNSGAWSLAFNDQFGGTTLNSSNWSSCYGTNVEANVLLNTPNLLSGYYRFAVGWKPYALTWYVEGVETFRVSASVSSEMYLIANVAQLATPATNGKSGDISRICRSTMSAFGSTHDDAAA